MRMTDFKLHKKDSRLIIMATHERQAWRTSTLDVGDRIDLIKLRNFIEKEIEKQYD